jgi:hypothetical protein
MACYVIVVPERPPRPQARPGGVADERSVDVDERRDTPPPSECSRPIAVSTELPGPQQAWARYVEHSRGCEVCRDVDRHCDEADRLWKAWQAQARQALQQLG